MGTQTVGRTNRENRNQFDVFDRTRGEPEPQALHRLARQAREKGVQIIIDERNGHWATSASRPGERYVVSLLSCSCVGFCRHGRCHHFAAILAMYHSLPPLDPDSGPDGGGADVVDRPVRRFWREPAARTECELLNRAAARRAEVAAVAAEDVVVLVQPARSPRSAVEGVRVAHAGTRSDGSTYVILHADAVVIGGVPHRVGDVVEATDRRWGWVPARITCIRTVGATGKVWKVDVDGAGYGEATRSLSEVRAVAETGEEVRHAA